MTERIEITRKHELMSLPFGTKVAVVGRDLRYRRGVLFGERPSPKIRYEDGETDLRIALADSMEAGSCRVYLLADR